MPLNRDARSLTTECFRFASRRHLGLRRLTAANWLLAAALLFPAVVRAAVVGRVVAPSGAPIEGAEVFVPGEPSPVRTGADGRFTLRAASRPPTLTVRHPYFETATVEEGASDAELLRIVLTPRPVFEESVLILERRLTEDAVPRGTAASTAEPGDRPVPPSTASDMITATAGVAENGQGGIFRVFSIRGLSRQRVQTLIGGMRLVTDRRAGISASFLDPLLLENANVVRGPVSSSYGSGALGGVVEFFPRVFQGGSVAAGWSSEGNANWLSGGWGGDGWSIGAARRSQSNTGDPGGNVLDDHFTQYSATVERRWTARGVDFDLLAIPAEGRSIGKASTDFPGREVEYPSETHLLVRFGARSERWRVRAFIHPNDLETRTKVSGVLRSEVVNRAFDFGGSGQWEYRGSGKGPFGRVGIEYFGRRDVDAVETTLTGVASTLDDGSEDEPSAYGTAGWTLGPASLEAGARYTWVRQRNDGGPSSNDGAWNAFAGGAASLGRGVDLSVHFGTGTRFPGLSERFFSGTTGRGEIVGNEALQPERAVNGEIGVRWVGRSATVAGFAYRNRITGFIERVEIAPDVLTFINSGSGTIDGAEIEGYARVSKSVRLQWSAFVLRGTDDSGGALQDVPPPRATLDAHYSPGRWRLAAEAQYRWPKTEPAPSEKEIPRARLLSASVGFAIRPDLFLYAGGANLLDETYEAAADEKSATSTGRSFFLGLAWESNPRP